METPVSLQARLRRAIEWMPPRWTLLVLLCGVLILRGRFILAHSEAFATDPDGYYAVARALHQEGMFGAGYGRFVLPRPTATRPPLYPLMLAIAGPLGLSASGIATVLHALLGTLTVWGVWRLSRLWGLPPGAGLIAAGLVAVDPILLGHSVVLMTETTATFLAVMALVAITCFAQANSLPWAVTAGVAAGLCVLCRPEFLVWVLGVAVAFPVLASPPRRGLRLAAYVMAAAAVMAPWGVRNWYQFGRPVITTTHGGFTLLLANNPDYYEYLRTAPWGSVWDGKPIYEQWEQQQITSRLGGQRRDPVDEVANDRWAYRQALEHIRAEPGLFAWSCLARVGRLWNVLPHATSEDESTGRRGMRYAVAIWYTFEFALAVVGVWFLRGKLFAAPWVWGTLLVLSITAVHALYWTDMRMRAPLAGVVALAAAWGLATLACGKPDASRLSNDA